MTEKKSIEIPPAGVSRCKTAMGRSLDELKVKADSLKGKAREEALSRIAAIAPRYGEYQKKTDREIPIIRLTPAG